MRNGFFWKPSVGPVAERPGHWNGMWQYWSTDGARSRIPMNLYYGCNSCCSGLEGLRMEGTEQLSMLFYVASASTPHCWEHIL